MKLIFTGKNDNIKGCFEHQHPSFEIVTVKNGDCITVVEKDNFKLQKNSVLIIPPNTNHKSFSETTFSDLFLQTDSLPFDVNKTLCVNDFSGNLLRLSETIHSLNIQGNRKKIVDDLFLTFTDLLANFVYTDKHNEIALRLKNAIEKKFTDTEFSLATSCKSLGYNQDYLRRLFCKEFGVSPVEYLNKLRLDYAEKLICNTNYPINAVALQSGYADPYYFSRVFTKRFGLSPINYRRAYT